MDLVSGNGNPWIAAVLFLLLLLPASRLHAEDGAAGLGETVRLVEWNGLVEHAPAGAQEWSRVLRPADLKPGDRLRTGASSRATLQFSDRSVFRLDQLSVLELQPAHGTSGWKQLLLRVGGLFFLDRERPSRIEIRTPTTTSAIRGTEFHLKVSEEDASVDLIVFDGEVSLANDLGEAIAANGQQIRSVPGNPPATSPVLLSRAPIQWALYYPAVVAPDDLRLPDDELRRLGDSLAHARAGDVRRALETLPVLDDQASPAAQIYAAGLRITAGRLEALNGLDPQAFHEQPTFRALQRLQASVLRTPDPSLSVTRVPSSTASEALADSYAAQSEGRLPEALAAASRTTELLPQWGSAWIRRAELEWSLGRHVPALQSLRQGRSLAPRDPRSFMLEGFIALDRGRVTDARSAFETAWSLDSSLGDVALGFGLCAARDSQRDEVLRWLQVAAVLEPQRALLRSYLGKAFAELGEDTLARDEWELAIRTDPFDPTPWLYRALHEQQTFRNNAAVRSLERSIELNDERGVFRSRMLLDHDRAVRRADLSAVFADAGLPEPGERMASRAVNDDYSDASAHLFRARTLQRLEDTSRFDLRYESARQRELLLAGLLAPAQGAALSHQLPEQEHLRYFEVGGVHGASSTLYRSVGDWEQAATLYGTTRGLAYALDGQWLGIHGDRPNADHELSQLSLQTKQRLDDRQAIYLQAGVLRREGGDPTRLFDPQTAIREYHFEERETPSVAIGYDMEWSAGWRTLALVSRTDDRLEIRQPEPQVLFLRERDGLPRALSVDPFFRQTLNTRFPLTSVELQQIWQTERQTAVAGLGYQGGEMESDVLLERTPGGALGPAWTRADFSEIRAYAYYTLRPWRSLRLTAGVAAESGTRPWNPDWPPLDAREDSDTKVLPKLGLTYDPWEGGHFRAAWTRDIGGADFSGGFRLEPTEVGEFLQTYRSLVPPSVAASMPGEKQEMLGIGFDQSFGHGTYFGITLQELSAEGRRGLGVARNLTLAPVPDAVGQLDQTTAYRERSGSLYVRQLLGDAWSVGVAYTLSQTTLDTGFPTLSPNLPGVAELSTDAEAVYSRLIFSARYQHPSGFHAEWSSEWHAQENSGDHAALGSERFWQHHAWVGYTLARHRADLQIGLLNLGDEDYRLNPLSAYRDPPRRRTLEVRLRFAF